MLRSDFGAFSTSALSSYGPSMPASRVRSRVTSDHAACEAAGAPRGDSANDGIGSSRSITIGSGAGRRDSCLMLLTSDSSSLANSCVDGLAFDSISSLNSS